MTKLNVFLDPNWRKMEELFSGADKEKLGDIAQLIWARNEKADQKTIDQALPDMDVLIAASPVMTAEMLDRAPNLKAIVEVSGAFPSSVDYAACFDRGVEVLSCAPGFRESVAEMCLAMILGGGRGLVCEHEAFRQGRENWLADNDATDFTLYRQTIGLIGYGSISRELRRLIRPFGTEILAYDPWLSEAVAREEGIKLCPLDEVLRSSRCVVVAAAPTSENRGMIGAREIAMMQKNALLVVISRAHLVDFSALTDAVQARHIRAAIDVFPQEPMAANDPLRQMEGVVLSPHRAAAVPQGRHLIGKMILDDVSALSEDRVERRLLKADRKHVEKLAGVGDADLVGKLADQRG